MNIKERDLINGDDFMSKSEEPLNVLAAKYEDEIKDDPFLAIEAISDYMNYQLGNGEDEDFIDEWTETIINDNRDNYSKLKNQIDKSIRWKANQLAKEELINEFN